MKRTIILTTILFFSFFALPKAEAGCKAKRPVVCTTTVVVQKPVVRNGHWKWSPRLRKYVWINSVKTKKVRRKRVNRYYY